MDQCSVLGALSSDLAIKLTPLYDRYDPN